MSGKNFFMTALVTALVGAAAPVVVVYVRDSISPGLEAYAQADGADGTVMTPDVMTPGDVQQVLAGTAGKQDRIYKASPQQVELVLSGSSSHTVTLTNIKAHIIAKSDPVSGTLWFAPGQGADVNVKVGARLDSSDLAVHDLQDDGALLGRHFEKLSYTFKSDEAKTFEITASALRGSYTWNIEVDYVVDGKAMVEYVDGEDGPFRLSTPARSYGVVVQPLESSLLVTSSDFCPSHRDLCEPA